MKNLECSSRGDKRFSALYAKVNGHSIEHWYQSCKRDSSGNIPGKGKHVDHVIWKNIKYPASKLSEIYEKLWRLYFKQNPELLEYAAQFDTFTDMFKGKSINSQADVIAKIVKESK